MTLFDYLIISVGLLLLAYILYVIALMIGSGEL